jgi:hypothetical protein
MPEPSHQTIPNKCLLKEEAKALTFRSGLFAFVENGLVLSNLVKSFHLAVG